MCTSSTLTRLVRWSVRELASCFLACTFSEEKQIEMNPSPSLKHPMRHIVSETKRHIVSETEDNMRDKKISDKNRRRRNHSQTMLKSIASMDNESENLSRIYLPDEEFIVFCFKEDGAFDVMIESNKSEESNRSERNSWSVNRKIDCTEDAERDEPSSDEIRSNEDASEGEANAAKEQGGGERGIICREVELASGSLRRLEESRDSFQFDGSTGSFTFPVLGLGWMGTPMRMPISEGIRTRQNKAHCVRFQCFRF